MSRRPLALVALSLATLTLAACSDITAPTPTSQGQLKPGATANTGSSSGGTLLSSGKSN